MPMLLMGMSASPPQLIRGDSRMQRCTEHAVSIRVAEHISAGSSAEVCRAVRLSWRALQTHSEGVVQRGENLATVARADSVHVARHDFPVLGGNKRRSLYQLGFFLAGGDYREVVVDRASWMAEVQVREGQRSGR
jgi:hypothetical protein